MIKNTIMKKLILGLLGLLALSFNSCSSSENEEWGCRLRIDSVGRFYNESNYDFNLINLWGSPAAVWDDGEHYIFQGDIVLDKNDSTLFLSKTRGAARIDKRWPDNVVYYDYSDYPSELRSKVWDAIKEVELNSYVTFKQRYKETNYIKFIYVPDATSFDGQSNYIGFKGGMQTIELSKDGALSHGTIMHEICHALGLYHEMCRADRDKYIKINFDGMSESERYQFKTYKERGDNGVDVGPFDFNSIMLYSSWVNGKVVATKLDGSTFWGTQGYLTSYDIMALAKAQPLGKYYTFFSPTIQDEYQIDDDNLYQRTRFLRCPEGAEVDLKLQYKFDPSASKFGMYSLNDFDINITVELIDWKSMKTVYIKDFPLDRLVTSYKNEMISLKLNQGAYRVALRLSGTCKNQNDKNAKDVLTNLMYNPVIFLHLDRATINGVNATIPSDYGYPADLRRETFITF